MAVTVNRTFLTNFVRQRTGLRLLSSNYAEESIQGEKKSQTQVKHSEVNGADVATPLPFGDIPGPKENRLVFLLRNFAPIFGKFKLSQRLLYDVMMHERYGSLARVPKLGRQPYAVFVFDPQAYADIYRMEGRFPYRTPFTSLWKVIEDNNRSMEPGLLSLNNDEWIAKRNQLQPKMMHLSRLHAYIPPVEDITEEFIDMLDKMAEGRNNLIIPNVRPLLQQWNVEALIKILFNVKIGTLTGSTEATEIHKAFTKAIEDTIEGLDGTQTAIQWWKYLPNRNFKLLKNGLNELSRLSVKFAILGLMEMGKHPETGDMTPILAEIIVKHAHEPKKLVGFINDILIAGLHTTSGTAEMVLYYLSRNPEVQAKAREEVDCILEKSQNTGITPDILRRLHYVRACVRETLRFAPGLSSQVRSFKEDITLSGYHIPAKTSLYMMFNVSSKSEAYFKRASHFLPERWLQVEGTKNEEQRVNPYASLPFGHGPRMCIGRRIAELELHILITKILQHFVILPGHDVELRTNVLTYAEPPVGITLQKR